MTRTRSRTGKGPALACAALLASGCREKPHEPATRSAPSALESPIPGAPARHHALGELAQARDYTMSVDSVKDCPMEAPFAPRKGFVKVGVEVVISGSTGIEIPANPFYASLRDAAGEVYAATLAGCEPALPSVRLTRERSAHGFVTFEIPKLAQKLEIRYAPAVLGAPPEELAFSVTR